MKLDPRALSPDGYIIDQDKTSAVPYGRFSSDYNGCGWISAYNYFKALGGAPDFGARQALAPQGDKTAEPDAPRGPSRVPRGGPAGAAAGGAPDFGARQALAPQGDKTAPPEVEDVSQSLAAGSPFNCALGTGPRRLRRWLAGRGCPTIATAKRRAMPGLAAGAGAGIIMYLAGKEPHYVAFMAAGDPARPGLLRFFNAQPGNAAHYATMDEFLREQAKFPLCYLMVNENET